MPPTDDFHAFMARLGAGDDESARLLFCRFASRLISLARARLDHRIRQKVDPEDVLQSVYKSFFRRHAEGAFDLQGWDRLWALLAAITVNKCRRWNRHFRAASRDVGHEVSIHSPNDDSGGGYESLAGDPTPEEVVQLTELVENLIRELPAESRPILSLALEGCSVAEICEQAGRSQRSVYRVLNHVKETLERLSAEAASDGGDPQS
jgi:RNA polymerase sigma-70 factor (ECF subfamily)